MILTKSIRKEIDDIKCQIQYHKGELAKYELCLKIFEEYIDRQKNE